MPWLSVPLGCKTNSFSRISYKDMIKACCNMKYYSPNLKILLCFSKSDSPTPNTSSNSSYLPEPKVKRKCCAAVLIWERKIKQFETQKGLRIFLKRGVAGPQLWIPRHERNSRTLSDISHRFMCSHNCSIGRNWPVTS